MKRPNLFLVGAPKCGTSALHDYLAQHPDVFMSELKEPHYFCTDLAAPYAVQDEAAYLDLFKDSSASALAVGESSATYLYSEVAAAKLHAFDANAKIIAMLRNPLEMMPSLHAQKLVNGTEDKKRFADALAAEKRRKAGELPARGAFPFYYDAAMYSGQLARYFALFPRAQVHVIVFDDFKRDAKGVYNEVLSFLDLPPFEPEMKIVNRNKRVRSRRVHEQVQNPNSTVNRLPKPLNTLGYKLLDKLNSAPYERERLPLAVADTIRHDFAPEVERLSTLLGRDLSFWTV